MQRRLFLLSLAGAGTGTASTAGYARYVEPTWLRVVERSCSIPGLQPARPLRMVHLSDLHASKVVPNSIIEESVEAAIRLQPDVICVTGDFITNAFGFDSKWYEKVLRRLPAAAPTFAVMGNHDGGDWGQGSGGFHTSREVRELVSNAGIRVLHNDSTQLHVAGKTVELIGLGDYWADEFDVAKAFPKEDSGLPRIVLSHNPDTKMWMARQRWELMLSGHTHGGQVVIPMVGSPWAPVMDKKYLEGLKPWRDRQIHVSRGIGSAGGVRLNCRPEVTVLKFT